ncbi:MAG TPA: tetratricopeptide repeat protein [Bacteroidia bacterium]|jgi:serine phosphatase RsbU (regulator of sigma subunit)/uncharacterized protein HemY|nr:tetratricopeptide repeat protein [Bacteroidia bacterium]
MREFFLLISIIFIYFHSLSQNPKADSVLKILTTLNENEKPALYNSLCAIYRQSNSDKNIEYATKAIEISEKTGNEREKGYALSNLGFGYFIKSDYDKTTQFTALAIEIGEKLSDQKLLGACYNTLGLVNQNTGNMNKALDNFLLALKYRESIKDTNGMASTNNNLGECYRMFGRNTKALERLRRAELLYKSVNNKNGLGSAYSNMGGAYYQSNNYNSAILYFEKAMQLRKETKNKRGLAIILINLTELNLKIKNNKKALLYVKEATDITKTVSDPLLYVTSLASLANTYKAIDSTEFAEKIIKIAADSARKLGLRPQLQQFETSYGEILHIAGKDKEAYQHLLNSMLLKDSIYSDETTQKLNNLQAEIDRQKREAEIKLEEESNKQQKIVLTLCLIMLLLVAVFFITQYRIKHKANILLEDQNKIIALKNKEIGDSIDYAKKIQAAILPLTKDVERIFPKSFGVYKPKDIVSGDFYWFVEHQNKYFIAAVDCTGHGVPGAFMSMLGNDKLTHAVKDKNLTRPSDILSELNNSIKMTLKQNETDSVLRDGMDIGLCSYDFINNKLEFSGANRPLYLIRNGILNEYAPTKAAIGGLTENHFNYINHTIEIQKNDTIYIFTDGFADQFGGDKGKKFSTKRLKETLLSLIDKNMEEQEKELLRIMNEWTFRNDKKYDQTDDILIIGIRV